MSVCVRFKNVYKGNARGTSDLKGRDGANLLSSGEEEEEEGR